MVERPHRCTLVVRRGVDATTPETVRTPESSPPAVAPVHDRHLSVCGSTEGTERGAAARPPLDSSLREFTGCEKRPSVSSLVGREPELERLRAFAEPPRALVLTGGPGIGKTTLWEAGIDAARERGLRVVAARPQRRRGAALVRGADRPLRRGRHRRPAGAAARRARRRAAARRAGRTRPGAAGDRARRARRAARPGRAGPAAGGDRRRAVARRRPPPTRSRSPRRRLADEPVAFLLARRPGRRSPLERVLGARSGIEVGPLDLDALRRLLAERLGLSVPRPVLRRIAATTLGNPLFALELGRALLERGEPEIGDEIPLPDAVEEMLGTRVAALPERGSGGRCSRSRSAATCAPDELAAVAGRGRRRRRRRRAASSRRAASRAVAPAAGRGGAQALAAARAARAPRRARARGRRRRAARPPPGAGGAAPGRRRSPTRSRRPPPAPPPAAPRRRPWSWPSTALRLTPAGRPERTERLLALAGYLETAGARQRVTDLLAPELDALPAGGPRVRALAAAVRGRRGRQLPRPHARTSSARWPRAATTRRCARSCSRRWRSTRSPRASSAWPRPRPGRRRRCPGRGELLALRALGLGAQPARPPDRRRLRALRRRGRRRRRPPDRLAGAGRGPAARLARRTWSPRARR